MTDTGSFSNAKPRPLALLFPVLLIAASLVAYSNALDGPFLFDDHDAIVENPHIRQLWPLTRALSAPPQAPVAGRPVVSFTLALNYAVGGLEVRGYHLFNVAVHVLCGLLLFGVVRRTLQSPTLARSWSESATPIAGVTSLLWLLHPLNTETVNYVVQRTESVMALFYLLTLYAAIRALDSTRPGRWVAAAVVACVLGMASKESMVTAPLIVLLYDRSFHFASIRQALARRRGLYGALAASWSVLVLLVAGGPRSETVGLALGVGPVDYARQQFVVIVDYLHHTIWPHPLVLDYGYARPLEGSVALQAGVIGFLLAATAWVFLQRPAWGFPAVWAAVILGPTSSIVPIVSEVGAERRMYLPLAGLLALIVALAWAALRRWFPARVGLQAGPVAVVLVVAAALGLGWATIRRNAEYADAVTVWQTAVAATPANPRAHNNLGRAMHIDTGPGEALEHYRRAIELDAAYARAHYNLGVAVAELGDADRAVELYRRALELNPGLPRAHNNLGSQLAHRGELDEALGHFREAARIAPTMPRAQHNLGRALRMTGRPAAALGPLRRAAELDPEWAAPLGDLAWILATAADPELRDAAEALRLAERACEMTARRNPVLLDTLAAAQASSGAFEAAVETATSAARLALETGRAELADEIRKRLELYRRDLPYREP